MGSQDLRSAESPAPDQPLVDIANYVADYYLSSSEAFETARYVLLDSVACALMALRFPECAKLAGPIVPGATMTGGARVLGTHRELDPAQAAFAIGTQIAWLGFNDAFIGDELVHPSDNLGAILAVADWSSRKAQREGGKPVTIRQVLTSAIKAHEIQGCHALKNDLERAGLDHSILVRVASAAVTTAMLGGGKDDIVAAVSNAWADGGTLRVCRHAPNVGPRRGWAAGDACRRAVIHALAALDGEPGCPTVLSAPTWGFADALLGGRSFEFGRSFGSHVVENVVFRLAHPGEVHAQTAVEAALVLHPEVAGRVDRIARVVVETQAAGLRILDRSGPLATAAERDHCLQYMVAVPLLHGRLSAADYEEPVAADPRLAALCAKTEVREDPAFTRDYLDPGKRTIGNAVQVFFDDGQSTSRIAIHSPAGHRERRVEGIPRLMEKFERAVCGHLARRRAERVLGLVNDVMRFENTPVQEFLDQLAV